MASSNESRRDGGARGPRLLLTDHHTALEAACAEVRASAVEGDPRDLIVRYRIFEHAVLEHLNAEEEAILPRYAEYDAEEADTIRAQHAGLRQLLLHIGVDAELHHLRVEAFDALVRALRTYADYEERGMYRWAQLHLPLRTRRQLFVRLGHSLRELARRRQP